MDVDNVDIPPAANPVDPVSRQVCIQHCIESLTHACQCRDRDCNLRSCQKMKRVVGHTKVCQRKVTAGCRICKQLIALCCYHARHCLERFCPVPFCPPIRKKLSEKKRLLLEQTMTADKRKDVADLLLEVISSSPDSVIFRKRIRNKELIANKLEENIFQSANTVADYHRLLAAKKWEIEMDIEQRQTAIESTMKLDGLKN